MIPRVSVADLVPLAAGFTGRKAATFAAGFLAAVWFRETFPDRWAALCVVLAGGVAGVLAVALLGGSVAASAANGKRNTENARPQSLRREMAGPGGVDRA